MWQISSGTTPPPPTVEYRGFSVSQAQPFSWKWNKHKWNLVFCLFLHKNTIFFFSFNLQPLKNIRMVDLSELLHGMGWGKCPQWLLHKFKDRTLWFKRHGANIIINYAFESTRWVLCVTCIRLVDPRANSSNGTVKTSTTWNALCVC